jgi:molybdopterin molybdotransferase
MIEVKCRRRGGNETAVTVAHAVGDNLETVAAAQRRLLESLTPLGPESVGLDDALGRVLAETVHSSQDLPRFDNSAMDGYAVRAVDILGAGVATPVSLAVMGESRAGGAAPELTPGRAIRIMTGAPLPAGADTVVRQEDTQRRDGEVLVEVAVPSGTSVRRRGEDLIAGQAVLEGGHTLTSIEIGVAAALGRDHVLVGRRPRVGVLATGDELVAAGASLSASHVVDSNSPMLIAAVREAGGDPTFLGIAADTPEAVRRLLNVDGYDVIVSSAGVSVGEHDHVRDIVAELGEVNTWRIAMRPGKPMLIGTVGHALFLGLPGNPVSASVTFELFVRPAIGRLQGATEPMRRRISVRLGETMQKPMGMETYVRAVLRRVDGALPVATSSGPQGSHMLRSLAAADCLLVLQAEPAEVPEGAVVEAIPLR